MLSNREIVRQFRLYAELLLLHNKNERLSALLSGAAYRIGKMSVNIVEYDKVELQKLFRTEIIELLQKLKNGKTIDDLDELIQLTPTGLFEMMRIRGLGGKKLSVLWQTAKIDSIDALLEACKNNMLTKIPGFGAKTQQNIIDSIEAYRGEREQFYFASVADTANELVLFLQKALKTKLISLCGEVRRECLTVSGIEIIAAIEQKKLNAKLLRGLVIIQESKKDYTSGHTLDEIPVMIYHITPDNFYSELFQRTGNEAHVNRVLKNSKAKKYSSEEAIYIKAKLPYIVPEMREDNGEWGFKGNPEDLITLKDIKGVVHNHTTWSDGVDTLPDFVKACKERGFEYVVISDHSKNAHYAGGLKEEKALRQLKEIDALNEKMAPFKIFKSIECDILVSGELDYGPDILEKFDLVIISIHQLLKMDIERATKRIIKAIENPFTTILGHMSGRQLLIRPGYPLHFKKVIDACAANKVIIEINANPYRLDMDWSHLPYALNKGVMISINPDAHSIAEIDNIRWGVSAARKGGLTKDMTWNAKSLREIQQWLKKNSKFKMAKSSQL